MVASLTGSNLVEVRGVLLRDHFHVAPLTSEVNNIVHLSRIRIIEVHMNRFAPIHNYGDHPIACIIIITSLSEEIV